MISFKEYSAQFEKKFISLNFTDKTNELLFKYATRNRFDLSIKYNGNTQNPKDFEFHTTIFYTSNRCNIKNQTINLEKFELIPDYLKLLGVNEDIPVLKLKNTGGIEYLRNMFIDQGCRDEWPTYQPHISLSYNKKFYNLDRIKLPDFPIIASSFTIEKQ